MGSANGAARGQLRPYLSGRTPPFLLVGLLVVLGILGFSYWSLNTQYNDLQTEIQKLQDRLRIYAEKRESVEKMNSALQAQMQTYKEENKKYGIAMYKKEQDLNTVGEQLRNREEEVNKANSQIDSLKTELEKIEAQDKQKELEINSLQDQAKSLKSENQELIDSRVELEKKLDLLQKAAKHLKNAGSVISHGVYPQDLQADRREIQDANPDVGIPPQSKEFKFRPQLPESNRVPNEEHRAPIPGANPDEGIPPQSKEFKFQPQLPESNRVPNEEHKAPTPAPESPDEANLEKLSETTSRVQLNEPGNSVNEADQQGVQNPGANV